MFFKQIQIQQSQQNIIDPHEPTILYIVGSDIDSDIIDEEDGWRYAVNTLRRKGYNVEVLEFSKQGNESLTTEQIREEIRKKCTEINKVGNALTVFIDAHGNGVDVQDHTTQLDGHKISTYLIVDDITTSYPNYPQLVMGECNGGETLSDLDKVNNKNYNLVTLSGANTVTRATSLYELLRELPERSSGFIPDVSGVSKVFYTQVKLGIKVAGFFYSPENGLYDMEEGLRELIELKEERPERYKKRFGAARENLEKTYPGFMDEANELIENADDIYSVRNKDFNKMLYAAAVVNEFKQNTTPKEIENDRMLFDALTDESLTDKQRAEKVKQAIKNGAEVNRMAANPLFGERWNSTNMYFAVYYGDLKTVKTLVNKGAIITNAGDAEPEKSPDDSGMHDNLAVLAANLGKYDLMFYLLDKNPEFAKANKAQGTNVIISSLTGEKPDVGVATRLLNKYPDIDVMKDSIFGDINIVSLAISSGNTEFIKAVDQRLSEQYEGLTIKKIIEQQNEFENKAAEKYHSINADIKTKFESSVNEAKGSGYKLNGFEDLQEASSEAHKEAKTYYSNYKYERRGQAKADLVIKSAGNLKGLMFLKSKGAILDKYDFDEHILITSLSSDSFGEMPRETTRFEAFDFLLENCPEVKGRRLLEIRDRLLDGYLNQYPKNVSIDAITHFFKKTGCPVNQEIYEEIKEDVNRREAQLNEGWSGVNEAEWRQEIVDLKALQAQLDKFPKQPDVFDYGFDLEAIKKGDYSSLKDSGNNNIEAINLISFLSKNGFNNEDQDIIKNISGIFSDVKISLVEVKEGEPGKYRAEISTLSNGEKTTYKINAGKEK